MGLLRVTVCTSVLAVAALTPAAYAADPGGVSVIPASPAPGSDVTLRVTGCAERTAVAASAAFVADARLTVAEGGLTGESRVRSTLAPGTYTVTVTCGDAERTGTFTVRKRPDRPSTPGATFGTANRPPAPGTAGKPPEPGAAGEPLAPGMAARSAAPGTAGEPPAAGTAGKPPAPGTAGEPPAPGTAVRPPAPGTAGRPQLPEGGGQPSEPGHDGQPSEAGRERDGRLTDDNDSPRPRAHASPVAPVAAGGGGAADLVAAADRETGPGTARGVSPGTAQGVTALVLAGVAALVIALGGLRRSRGTD